MQLYTYAHHKQVFDNAITAPLERNLKLKVERTLDYLHS